MVWHSPWSLGGSESVLRGRQSPDYHILTPSTTTLHHMGFSKTNGGWSKGVEERAEEEGPSSPPRDHRVSPDIQFVSDHEAGPSESVRRDTSVP